jgi:2-isopropylmalate synthase
MDITQQPSGMPIHKYRPFHEQIAVDLPDRTWPTKRSTEPPAGVRSTCATATRR